MTGKLKIIVLFLLGTVGYLVWAVMAYFDPAQRGAFLTYNISIVTGVIGLALRDMRASSDPTPTPVPAPVVAPAAPEAPAQTQT